MRVRGRFAPQVELDRIVIEGGKATGIALKDGRTVRARQFVASTLNVHQTFEDYIGRAQHIKTSWPIPQKHRAGTSIVEGTRVLLDQITPCAWALRGAKTTSRLYARMVSE